MSCGLIYLMVFPGRGLISTKCCETLHQIVSGCRWLTGLRMRQLIGLFARTTGCTIRSSSTRNGPIFTAWCCTVMTSAAHDSVLRHNCRRQCASSRLAAEDEGRPSMKPDACDEESLECLLQMSCRHSLRCADRTKCSPLGVEVGRSTIGWPTCSFSNES